MATELTEMIRSQAVALNTQFHAGYKIGFQAGYQDGFRDGVAEAQRLMTEALANSTDTLRVPCG